MKSKKLISLGIMAAMLTGQAVDRASRQGKQRRVHRKRQKQQNQHQQKAQQHPVKR